MEEKIEQKRFCSCISNEDLFECSLGITGGIQMYYNISRKSHFKDDIYSEEKCKELGWISSSVKDVIQETRKWPDQNYK